MFPCVSQRTGAKLSELWSIRYINQQSRVCLMLQLLFKYRYAKTLSTVRLHKDSAWTSASWTRAHTHTHTYVLTQSLTFCGHALKATVDLCERPLPKIYYFHMVLIHSLTAKSSMENNFVCVCILKYGMFTSMISRLFSTSLLAVFLAFYSQQPLHPYFSRVWERNNCLFNSWVTSY